MWDPRDARTFLFVPGSRPDRFDRAAASGADVVILDLEDAVESAAKESARSEVGAWLAGGASGIVRLNAHGTPWYAGDCDVLAGVPGLAGVMLPKAEDPAALADLSARLGGDVPIVALVETAVGVRGASRVAAASGVVRLAFGSVDLAVDLGCDHSRDALLLARSALVVASRAAGLPAPVDGVTTDLDDASVAGDDARYARSLGFGGKLCIHPRQLEPVSSAFAPTPAEVAWATRVAAAAADGRAQRVDGAMVDRPVLERARRILSQQPDLPAVPTPTDMETA